MTMRPDRSDQHRTVATKGLALASTMAIFVVLVLFGFAGPAGGQDPGDCSRSVVDTSGQVDVVAVEQAIAGSNQDVTIVVRSFARVDDANLVAAIDDIVVSCFGDDADGVRPDVVVLGLSVDDRLSDVLVGSRWGAAVPDPDRIRSDVMGARFADGDYTGGLIAAVEEIGQAVDRVSNLAPSDDETGTDPADEAGAEPSPTTEPVPEVEPVGDGQSPWAIAGGLAGVGACGGVFFLVSRHRKLSSARADFERSSAGPLARLGVLRERDARLVAQADTWSKTTTGRTLVTLRGLSRDTDRGRAAADRGYGLLDQAIPDGVKSADLAELERARERVLELSRSLDQQDEALDRLAAFGAHIDHLRVALPAKAALLDEEVDEGVAMVDQRESEGWAVDSQRTELNAIGDTLDALNFEPLELDLVAMSEQIEATEARLFATDHYLQSLPSRVNSLKKWNAGLEVAADLEVRRIEDLRRQFATVAASHASDSWQWAADYPEQAVEELEKADGMQDIAISEMISGQRFDDAGRQLDAAGLRLMAADHLLDQVDDLLVDLERARQEAPGIVDQCREVLRDLTRFVSQHQPDLDPGLAARPADLARAIDGLQRELQQKKPNYLRVAETGDRVNRQIDELLVQAQDQHLRMEALRRELDREVARAARSIGRARRSLGWELFQSRDGSTIDQLEEALRRLPSDPEQAIEHAADIADDALRVQERIIARRRRSSVWVNTGSGWGSGSSGGGSFGGSSSSGGGSFGGSSSGGRSFGGGSSSGGRSFGGGRSSGSF